MKYFNVWQESELSFTAKGVYCLLRQFANNITLECWPSVGRMCELAGLSKPTLRKALKELADRRFLRIIPTVSVRGVVCVNHYQLINPDERSGPDPGAKIPAGEGKNLTPAGKNFTAGGKNFTGGGKNFTPNLSNRTIPNNCFSEGNGSRAKRIPRAFASLGIVPEDYFTPEERADAI